LHVASRAHDRATYLLRPDYGRRLSNASAAALVERANKSCDLVLVAADGLSALAVQRHTLPLLEALRALLPAAWSLAPIVIAEKGRVGIGDAIGELFGANGGRLIGERPGLVRLTAWESI
jgi:ethanolamine ammonia-lyase small subunit